MRSSFFILGIVAALTAFGQKDTVRFGIDSYILTDKADGLNFDSLLQVDPSVNLDYQFYKTRYKETDLMYKITDNRGDGFDSLYGTRNMRPILHGVAYRGGANNYYHKTDKRNNHNPLPLDGLSGLCNEGFSASIYLYQNNFENYVNADTCNCIDNSMSKMDYYQLDYYDSTHVRRMVEMTYNSITKSDVGPIYLHCWNGWHASGFIAAVILKQFCEFSSWNAVNYWDLGTDGANTSPRYQHQRERIKEFEPYPEFNISDSLKNCHCPPMPTNIDSTQLHIEIEHLVVVPEAIPIGLDIILYNVNFGSGKTSFSDIGNNPDIVYLKTALDNDPKLKIEIGGYTDNSGSTTKNTSISNQRAKFVYDHMLAAGYSAERMTYKGYGPSKPAFSNRYKSTREGNRRIEIKVMDKTTHDGTKLVNENGFDTTIKSAEETEKMYLSYFFKYRLKENLGAVFIVDSLIFPSGKAVLPAAGIGYDYLVKLSDYLSKNKGLKININGYTDASGIAEKNQVLSEERSKAVYNFLIEKGIHKNRLNFKGYGANNPIAANRYKWGRDLNRRIEIEFVSD